MFFMEYRKIISFGKSSFVVSIPKTWMKNNKLKKGSSVKIVEDNESLIISPLKDEKSIKNNLSKNLVFENEKQLQRELISAYIEGYDTINIKVKDLEKKMSLIHKIFENLIALEIVSNENNVVVAKDYLNINEVNLKNIIIKIDNNIKSMFLDLLEYSENSIDKNNKSNKKDNIKYDKNNKKPDYILISIERDKSINKLSFLGFRVIRKLLDSQLKGNFSILTLFKSWSIIVQLEKVGDELKRIFRLYEGQKIYDNVKELYSLYNDVLKIYYNDKKSSYRRKNLEVNENIRKFRKKIKDRLLKEDDVVLTQIYEKMINISSYLEEILRLNFDFSE